MKKPRLTYANVMSTVAVFLALGGSAVAVTRIDGSTIKPRSIPNSSFKQIVSSSSKTSTAKPRSKRARASAASGSGENVIVTANVDQTALLLDVNGLKLWLKCKPVQRENSGYNLSPGHAYPALYASTDENGTATPTARRDRESPLMDDYRWNRGEMIPAVDAYQAFPSVSATYFMQAPSGKYLSAFASYGVGQFGTDCWASAFTLQ